MSEKAIDLNSLGPTTGGRQIHTCSKGVIWRPFYFSQKGDSRMVTIGEIICWKSVEVYRRLCEQFMQLTKKKPADAAGGVKKDRKRPAERLSFDQLRRMMGDTGPRQFLKERGNTRK